MATIGELLIRDHRELCDVLARIRAKRTAAATRHKLFAQFQVLLELHTRFEEETFYPAVRQAAELEDELEDALADHDAMRALLETLGEIDSGSEDWMETVAELADALCHHIEDEEADILPAARAYLDDAAAEELAGCYLAMRAERKAA